MKKHYLTCLYTLVSLHIHAGPLQLVLNPTVTKESLVLDSLRYTNQANQTYSITRLSLFLSDFSFQSADGSIVSIAKSVGWFDISKRRTSLQLPSVPDGKYTAVRFKIGLSKELNETSPWNYPADHPLNPNVSGLYWNWQGGYIFTAIEGLYRESNNHQTKGFSYHFANNQNLTSIHLESPFEVQGPTEIHLGLAIDQLLNGSQPIDFMRDGNSTHSKPDDFIAAALKSNFKNAFSLTLAISKLPVSLSPANVQPLYLPKQYEPASFAMSRRFPIPHLPMDNPLIQSRVKLGELLFHDKRLSSDRTLSCSSCHQKENGLSDANRFSKGVEGRTGTRQSMPLFNLAWKSSFFWDGRAVSLREQVLMPIQDHLEMNMKLETVVQRLQGDEKICQAFEDAFGSKEITSQKMALALENFLLTLISYDSKFDRVLQGKAEFTPEEQRGFELFVTENEPRSGRYGADCFHCHGGPLLTDHGFHNNGLDIRSTDPGLSKTTGKSTDTGKFATPSLRNIALTAPYMHDGRFQTLEEVVAHYSSGIQRSDTLDPNLAKHARGGLGLSLEDQSALVAFLKTLTDPKMVQTGESTKTFAATQSNKRNINHPTP